MKKHQRNQNILKKQSPTQSIGTQAEIIAKDYLLTQGLEFIQHQYRAISGEIDLIMKDKTELVFVEVRYRKSSTFITPLETVTWRKRKRLIRTALIFLQQHWTSHFSPRF